ncbi:MAG: hypothetical protein ACE3L7_07560 [Candidatus Pristimantibacillus sp.]
MDEERNEERTEPKERVRTSIQSNRQEYNPYASQPAASGIPSEVKVNADQRMKQSGLGIASFIISLASVALMIVGFIFAFVLAAQITGQIDVGAPMSDSTNQALIESMIQDSNSMVQIMMMIACIFGSVGVAFIGLILGIIGACSNKRRKTFAVIGIVLNGLIVLGTVGLFFIGILSGAAGL